MPSVIDRPAGCQSHTLAAQLADGYRMAARGSAELKGTGPVETFLW